MGQKEGTMRVKMGAASPASFGLARLTISLNPVHWGETSWHFGLRNGVIEAGTVRLAADGRNL